MSCGHAVAVECGDDGAGVLFTGAVSSWAEAKRERARQVAAQLGGTPVWVHREVARTDAELLAWHCETFTFCPDCGERLKP